MDLRIQYAPLGLERESSAPSVRPSVGQRLLCKHKDPRLTLRTHVAPNERQHGNMYAGTSV